MRLSRKAALFVVPLMAAGLLGGGRAVVHADTAQPYWEGTETAGVFCAGECPVEVEKQELTLKIPKLPVNGASAEEFAAYSASAYAEARYLFHNPSEADITMTLHVPFGMQPAYAPAGAGDGQYSVWVNGAPVECKVRHSYSNNLAAIEYDTALFAAEDRTNEFYAPDAAVTVYEFEGTEGELQFDFDCNPAKTRVISENGAVFRLKNGRGGVSFPASSGKVYAVGEPLEIITNVTNTGHVRITASQQTFREFALRGCTQSNVSTQDWYNGFVDMLSERTVNGYMIQDCALRAEDFMRWYEYEVEIPSGGVAENVVTAPLFPTIDGKISPRYEYSYLLSPAQKWADVKEFKIILETPYHLSGSSLVFEEENGRYVFTRDSLPQGELTFVLTESAWSFEITPTDFLKPAFTSALTILLIVTVIAVAVTLTIVLCVNRSKKSVQKPPVHASGAAPQDQEEQKEDKDKK